MSRAGGGEDSLVWQQEIHFSRELTVENAPHLLIKIRKGLKLPDPVHPSMQDYLLTAGFYSVDFVLRDHIDHHLTQALLERWRPETHTFHLRTGEMTITLQDVARLAGLPVEGFPITGVRDPPDQYCGDWVDYVYAMTGYRAGPSQKRNSPKFMAAEFRDWYTGVFHTTRWDEIGHSGLMKLTRSYIVILLGVLFSDSAGNFVNMVFLRFLHNFDETRKYSWGSAVLAHLYRQMCSCVQKKKTCAGALEILQVYYFIWLIIYLASSVFC